MTPKKKPSVIVMKRLDTQGLRLLSQTGGPGTRRAGVRLSASGGLTPHRRGEPISVAPPPDAIPAPIDMSVPTPAVVDPAGSLPEELRAFALAQLQKQKNAASGDSAPAPAVTKRIDPPRAALPALVIEAEPRRFGLTAWAAGLLVAGVFVGVTIARVIGGAHAPVAAHAAPADPPAMTAESVGVPVVVTPPVAAAKVDAPKPIDPPAVAAPAPIAPQPVAEAKGDPKPVEAAKPVADAKPAPAVAAAAPASTHHHRDRVEAKPADAKASAEAKPESKPEAKVAAAPPPAPKASASSKADEVIANTLSAPAPAAKPAPAPGDTASKVSALVNQQLGNSL